ncbi:MAG: hypothetical protein QOK37_250 [Thermoanaerobaculia bacterium]|jgi:hypothetical protein|nr:hypothetical protein [Thermoanaerobaculia bacterium]
MAYTLHPRSLTTLFWEIEAFALAQETAFVGTPGSVLRRRNASQFEFYAHQYYDALGAKRERYVAGPVGSEADAAAAELTARIADAKRMAPLIRLLGREGFQFADSRTFATLAALHNHRFFAAGGLLAGSHAYGVILNRLGVRAPSYRTEDVDLARGGPLAFVSPPKHPLVEILRDSGIEFVEIPQLDPRTPATSYKQRGRSTFQIELLAPARGEEIGSMAIPELHAHATTLPFLGYLLKESQFTTVLAQEGSCAVRVPIPERFAIHKLIVSALRRGGDAKLLKDRTQAIVLCAALGDSHPGALAAARDAVPRRAVKYFRRALVSVRESLEATHPRAWEELRS